MTKWPNKIHKVNQTLGNLKGEIWFDRWNENLWFQTSEKLYVPLEVNRILKTLPTSTILNITFKLTYSEHIQDLVLNKNLFLSLIPKSESLYHQPIILGLKHGVEFE